MSPAKAAARAGVTLALFTLACSWAAEEPGVVELGGKADLEEEILIQDLERVDAEPEDMSAEDCAMSLSCVIKKQLKEHQAHLEKAAEGGHRKSVINVQQIEDEKQKALDAEDSLHASYKRLLSGKPDPVDQAKKDEAVKERMKAEKKLADAKIKAMKPGPAKDKAIKEAKKAEKENLSQLSAKQQGKAQNEILQKTKTKKIMADDESEKRQKLDAKAKYERNMEKNNKSAKEQTEKAKIQADKEVDAVVKAQKKKIEASKNSPDSKQGPISQAADAKLKHYQAEMAAAKAEHDLANGKATAGDVERAKIEVKTSSIAAKAAEDRAIKHAQSQQNQLENAAHPPPKAENQTKLPEGAMAKAVKEAEAAVLAAEGEPEKVKTGQENAEGDDGKKVDKTGVTGACSEKACRQTCQTEICYRFCMRCKTIKSEIIKFVPGQGLVTAAGVAAVKKMNDPVLVHASWMNAAKNEMAKKDKAEQDADNYASKGIRSQYCNHCKKMCYEKVNGVSRTQAESQECESVCQGSIACKVGGTTMPNQHDAPVLDGYTEVHKEGGVPSALPNSTFTPQPPIDAGERDNALALAKLKEQQKIELAKLAAKPGSTTSKTQEQQLLKLKFMQQVTNLKMKQQAEEIMNLKARNYEVERLARKNAEIANNAQKMATANANGAKGADAATIKDAIKDALVVKLPTVTVVKRVTGSGADTKQAPTGAEAVAEKVRAQINTKAHMMKQAQGKSASPSKTLV